MSLNMKEYYVISYGEIEDLIDVTEDIMLQESEKLMKPTEKLLDLYKRRIMLVNLIKTRKYTENQYKEKEEWILNPEDFRYCDQEPPDYDECPCWVAPADPEGTTGTCEGDWGDCKLWYWNHTGRSYTDCDRFAIDCSKCLEVLCKFRKENK